jgi:hypothetical protein
MMTKKIKPSLYSKGFTKPLTKTLPFPREKSDFALQKCNKILRLPTIEDIP